MWLTLTAEYLERRMPLEWPKLRDFVKKGQGGAAVWDTTVADIIDNITTRVRGRVKACPANTTLGAEGSIPPELAGAAVNLCRLELIAIFPGAGVSLNEDTRKQLAKSANDDLIAVARCELSITPPADAAAVQAPAAQGVFGGDPLIRFPGECIETGP
jgi:hypothetical protein